MAAPLILHNIGDELAATVHPLAAGGHSVRIYDAGALDLDPLAVYIIPAALAADAAAALAFVARKIARPSGALEVPQC